MIDRDKETVTRPEALSREQIDARARQGYRPQRRRSRFPRLLIPLSFFALIAVLIARQEIPAVDNWWEKTFSPVEWEIKQTCRTAAVEMSDQRAFTRVVREGAVHETARGYYLDGLVLGEMGRDGVEQRIQFTCYLDSSRQLVKLNRLDQGAATGTPQ